MKRSLTLPLTELLALRFVLGKQFEPHLQQRIEMLLRVNLAIDAARYVRALLQEAGFLVDHATVNVHAHLLRAEEHVHVVHVLRRRVPGRRHHEHA